MKKGHILLTRDALSILGSFLSFYGSITVNLTCFSVKIGNQCLTNDSMQRVMPDQGGIFAIISPQFSACLGLALEVSLMGAHRLMTGAYKDEILDNCFKSTRKWKDWYQITHVCLCSPIDYNLMVEV